MTLLLKSKSDFQKKRILYLAAERAVVYHWGKGSLTESFVFDVNPAGLENFARYLFEVPGDPFYIMLDVVEEEYRLETIPHVRGGDRKALLARKKDRLFRNTPYCYATAQGREKEGRRDDLLLFSAITNPDIPAPWLKLLLNAKVPIAGMYSLPAMSGLLLKKLGIDTGNSLLVTIQSVSGLRQTFYKDKQLKISRLAKMPRLSTTPFGPYLAGEIEKIHRYLSSLRLLQNDEILDVYILSQGSLLEDLSQQFRDTDQLRYHLLEMNAVATAIGFKMPLATPYADSIYSHLLASSPPANQYANAQETRYYTMLRGRIGMLAASLLLLLVSAFWSGFNLIDGLAYQQDRVDAQEKANFYDARYRIAKERLPRTAVEPYDIKSAVDLVDVLAEHRATPLATMQLFSQALENYPDLHVQNVIWEASSNPNKLLDGDDKRLSKPDSASIPVDEKNYVYYQLAVIEGYVDPFDGNYRQALDKVNNIAEELRKMAHVQRVKILSLPLDVSSDSNVSGTSEKSNKKIERNAMFSLKIVLGVPRESV